MCQPKSKRQDLSPPDYVRDEWKRGDKNAIAQLFEQVNFDKDWSVHTSASWHFQTFLRGHNNFQLRYSSVALTSFGQDKFFSELLIIIKRKKTYQLVIDEGWYSASDLAELGWSK